MNTGQVTNKLNNEISVPLSVDRVRLQNIGLENSELELATALYQTYCSMPYQLDGKAACIMCLTDLARYYNLPYQTMYAASRSMIEKGIIELVSNKIVLQETLMSTMTKAY
jgi:DNA-binding MarR family transcriptional regulator